MRYLNFGIVLSMILSSCVFSGSPKVIAESDTEQFGDCSVAPLLLRDSITIDTLIGDFRVFYRVSDIVNSDTIHSFADENRKSPKLDKSILLNIRGLDSTSIVAYKTIDINDFEFIFPKVKDHHFVIETFYLKEVTPNSLVFDIKLCKFDENLYQKIDLIIDKKGTFRYLLQK